MTEYFVVSPLSTIRLSQGQILISSAKSLTLFEISTDFLHFLTFLRHPKHKSEVHSYLSDQGMDAEEVMRYWARFIEVEIVIQIHDVPLEERNASEINVWWDKKNIAKNDIRSLQILQVLLGNGTAIEKGLPLDSVGDPIPWFSYPAIEQLKRWDISEWLVFEYGCGYSTFFFSSSAKSVDGVESHRDWFEYLKNTVTKDVEIEFADDLKEYSESIHRKNLRYDLVVLDAHPTYRENCTVHALNRVHDNGLIILDDSTKYPDAANTLEEAGLTRIDYSGISPNEYHVQTTSFFLKPNFKPKLRTDYVPLGPP